RRRCLSLRALGGIGRIAARANVLAVGPGLGIHPETAELVRRVLAREDLPAVVDADGLNALVGYSNIYGATAWQRDSRPNRVLTPHLGEFCRLTGMSKREVAEDPIAKVNQFAQECGAVVLLKGAPTCVGSPEGNTYICPSGNAGMATAGSGDVLTGLIAGLIAQGLSVEEAACCGAFLHGRAGDIARDRIGEWGMVAGDIQDSVPEAIQGMFRNNTGVSHRLGPG
ncbi:MAG: NAD(P)H-hydrate dehydratase, partial [Gemmatimonadetes bacterium]|nr:NAD(P)H-hydrate dehydratase [Gemmatimonadota bacterium]